MIYLPVALVGACVAVATYVVLDHFWPEPNTNLLANPHMKKVHSLDEGGSFPYPPR